MRYNFGHNPETLIAAVGLVLYGLWALVKGRATMRWAFKYQQHEGATARWLGVFWIALGAGIFWFFYLKNGMHN